MAATHAVERAKWDLERLDRKNTDAWLQRKVGEQRAVINRLEAHLRSLGRQPHAPHSQECGR